MKAEYFSIKIKELVVLSGLLGSLIYLYSCKNKYSTYSMKDDQMYDYQYAEFYCTGRWSTTSGDEELKGSVQKFLRDSLSAIEINEIVVWRYDDMPFACDSCGCWTGRVINVSALGKYSRALSGAGFVIALPPE